jgi:hypothetical protein
MINCVICDEGFNETRSYISHLKSKHSHEPGVQKELKKMAKPQFKKNQICDKCFKGYSTIYCLKNHKCSKKKSDFLESFKEYVSENPEEVSTEFVSKISNYLSELKTKIDGNTTDIDSNSNSTKHSSINNNINLVQNNTFNIQVICVNNISDNKKDISDFVTKKLIQDYYKNNEELFKRYIKYTEERGEFISNHIGLEKCLVSYKPSLEKLDNLITAAKIAIKDEIIEYLTNLFTSIFFSKLPQYQHYHSIYVFDKKITQNFYVKDSGQWTLTGNLRTLGKLVDAVYDYFVDNMKKNEYIVCKKITDDCFFKDYINLRNSISKDFFNIAYINRHVVKPTFDATKNIIDVDLNNEINITENLPDIDFSSGGLRPTYIIKTEEMHRNGYSNHTHTQKYNNDDAKISDSNNNDNNSNHSNDSDNNDNNDDSNEDDLYNGPDMYTEQVNGVMCIIVPDRNNSIYPIPEKYMNKNGIPMIEGIENDENLLVIGRKRIDGSYDMF